MKREPHKPPAATDDPDNQGLRCHGCGCPHLPVLYTRPKAGGRIMRKRQCRNCGRTMVTYEES